MKHGEPSHKGSKQNSVDALSEAVLDARVDELKSKDKLGVRPTSFDGEIFQNPNIMPFMYVDEKSREAEAARQKDI